MYDKFGTLVWFGSSSTTILSNEHVLYLETPFVLEWLLLFMIQEPSEMYLY